MARLSHSRPRGVLELDRVRFGGKSSHQHAPPCSRLATLSHLGVSVHLKGYEPINHSTEEPLTYLEQYVLSMDGIVDR